jgi:hypothetical protein
MPTWPPLLAGRHSARLLGASACANPEVFGVVVLEHAPEYGACLRPRVARAIPKRCYARAKHLCSRGVLGRLSAAGHGRYGVQNFSNQFVPVETSRPSLDASSGDVVQPSLECSPRDRQERLPWARRLRRTYVRAEQRITKNGGKTGVDCGIFGWYPSGVVPGDGCPDSGCSCQ